LARPEKNDQRKNMNITPATIVLSALVAAASLQSAFAQQLKPGLWQVQMKMSGVPDFEASMAELRESMASMSPEERKQMEAAMGKSGVQIGAGANGGTAVKFCMTREQAERREVPASTGDCKVTQQSRSGNLFTTAFSCTNPKSTGVSQVTFAGPQAYATKTSIVTEERGKKETTVMENSAKWLAADCGAVKPLMTKAK
jgi:hypothetical protein